MVVKAGDVITQDLVEERVVEVLTQNGINEYQINDVNFSNNKLLINTTLGNTRKQFDVLDDSSLSGDYIDEFFIRLDKYLREVVLTLTKSTTIGNHYIAIIEQDSATGEFEIICRNCGMKLAISSDKYKNATERQKKLMKKWGLGFFMDQKT